MEGAAEVQSVIASADAEKHSDSRPAAFSWHSKAPQDFNFQEAVSKWRQENGPKLRAIVAESTESGGSVSKLQGRFGLFARKRPVLAMDSSPSLDGEGSATLRPTSSEAAVSNSATRTCDAPTQSIFEQLPSAASAPVARTNAATEAYHEENYEFLSVFSPFVFRHLPKTRLGVKTGGLSSIPTRFDAAFGDNDADETHVYNATTARLVDHALGGGQGTVIAFGQTGSGKTFTATALQRMALRHIFAEQSRRKVALEATAASKAEIPKKHLFDVEICVFENYRHELFDLLDESHTKLNCRENATGSIQVQGATTRPVASLDEAMVVVDAAFAKRVTHVTSTNWHGSSRSHAFCKIVIVRSPPHRTTESPGSKASNSLNDTNDHHVYDGGLTIVDLAGSERRKDAYFHEAARVEEMQDINWSLSCLKSCLQAIQRAESETRPGRHHHVKFRDSKLTLLLKEVFVDTQHLASFVACLSPTKVHWRHTEGTLSYCSALRAVDAALQHRTATKAELEEGLQLFYMEKRPAKASLDSVRKLLAKYKGRERELHQTLKRTYRSAPNVLLFAESPQALAAQNPRRWNRARLRKFVIKVLSSPFEVGDTETDGDAYIVIEDIAEQQALALRLNVTGSQFFAMDAEAIVRRLGGTLKCVHLRDLHLASQHLVCDMDMHDHWID
eukprot:INCI4030.7.p1 GENE.INCI4030.7~~INCI4030.7.p1  ORF type:complete len:674 (-),score=103.87 INCI4030.7:500-2521(-)